MSKLTDRLNEYIDKNGLRKNFFAEKLGMTPAQLTNVLTGRSKLPKKYWKRLEQITKGEISVNELMGYFLEDVEE
jgi:DNA-binding transcriptional regulator YdaS (Cro superfamily)